MIEYLIAHLIGDFYLQNENLALAKKTDQNAVLKHCYLYSIPFLILFVLKFMTDGWSINVLVYTIALILLHAIVDFGKFFLIDNNKQFSSNKHSFWIFVVDQCIHWSLIISLGLKFGIETSFPLSVFVFYGLVLVKPANIFVRLSIQSFDPKENVTGKYKSSEDKSKEGFVGAGDRIGTLERLLMLLILFMSNGNVAGIAIVLTLKTIARYKKISEDAKFAEYFVIGSLTSMLIVLLLYFSSGFVTRSIY